jgi:hypothetical protein
MSGGGNDEGGISAPTTAQCASADLLADDVQHELSERVAVYRLVQDVPGEGIRAPQPSDQARQHVVAPAQGILGSGIAGSPTCLLGLSSHSTSSPPLSRHIDLLEILGEVGLREALMLSYKLDGSVMSLDPSFTQHSGVLDAGAWVVCCRDAPRS